MTLRIVRSAINCVQASSFYIQSVSIRLLLIQFYLDPSSIKIPRQVILEAKKTQSASLQKYLVLRDKSKNLSKHIQIDSYFDAGQSKPSGERGFINWSQKRTKTESMFLYKKDFDMMRSRVIRKNPSKVFCVLASISNHTRDQTEKFSQFDPIKSNGAV